MQQPYKFSRAATEQLPTGNIPSLFFKLANKELLNREEKNELVFDLASVTQRHMGWAFPFAQFLKRYVVNINKYGWQEYYAIDATAIRKKAHGFNGVTEIQEIIKK